jgi:NAD(P)-dependent dehydrogenase (short-subunit alcohol dehydrogenase family)
MHVVLADIEAGALAEAEQAIKGTGAQALAVRTDVTSADDVERLADAAYRTFGAVHVVFNNAGVAATAATLRARAWEGPVADWSWTLAVNFYGVLYGVRAFVPRMLEGGDEGHVVNTASIAGLVSGANPYNVSKHGVVCFTEGLYRDLREIGARVSASVVCPGLIDTKILDAERNRGEGFGGPTDLAEHRPELNDFSRDFAAALRGGYPPDVVAAHVVDGIRNDQFYVLPSQAELLAVVDQRFTGLLERRNPDIVLPA